MANLGKKHYQDKAKKEIKENPFKLGYKDMHCKQGRLLGNSHGLYRTLCWASSWGTSKGNSG